MMNPKYEVGTRIIDSDGFSKEIVRYYQSYVVVDQYDHRQVIEESDIVGVDDGPFEVGQIAYLCRDAQVTVMILGALTKDDTHFVFNYGSENASYVPVTLLRRESESAARTEFSQGYTQGLMDGAEKESKRLSTVPLRPKPSFFNY